MNIYGLQKLSLLDYPGKLACTIFTGGCNFLCPYCHNSDLVLRFKDMEKIPEEYIFEFLEKRRSMLEGVCVTGGEPLLQTDILEFLTKLKSMGYSVKLDTNGSKPKKLKEILDANVVDYVAMDIKNSPKKYAQTIGLNAFDINKIFESAKILLESKIDYEFRTTVVKEYHDEDDFYEIANWLKGAKRYFLQSYRDSEKVIQKSLSSPDEKDLNGEILQSHKESENVTQKSLSSPDEKDLHEYLKILRQTIYSVELRGI